jgi:SNF2 family DNA or RNA helicase
MAKTVIAPTWENPVNALMKLAFDPSLQVYISSASTRALQGYLQDIMSRTPEETDNRARSALQKLQTSPATQDVLNHSGTTLISANSVYDVLMGLSMYFHPMADQQADVRRITQELEQAAQQRQEQATQTFQSRQQRVTSFRVVESTPDYINYGIAWSSHLPEYPKAFKAESNPIQQKIREQLGPKGVTVVRDKRFPNEVVLTNLQVSDIPLLKSVFETDGFNTDVIDQIQLEEESASSRRLQFDLIFENATVDTDYHIFIPFEGLEQRKDLKAVIEDLVNFAFPIMGAKPRPMAEEARAKGRRDIATKREELITPAGTHYAMKKGLYLKGTYGNYRDLQTLLNIKQVSSNLDDLVLKVGSELRNSKHVQVTEILNGVLDKYYKTRAARHRLRDQKTGLYVPDEEQFNNEVMEYEFHKPNEEPYRLRPLQAEGVRWLYSRQSAILGDEPGVGKTEQMIVAADMRTKEKNRWNQQLATGRVLVFTPASVVEQFGLRILATTGADEGQLQQFEQRGFCDTIATDVNQVTDMTKWLVMSYTKIAGANAEERLAAMRNLNFDVMILDECHLVKNPNAATSRNVIQAGKNIPFKWGASATTAANTPDDLHNQLLAVGHPLGYLGRAGFLRQYTGSKTIQMRGEDLRVDPANTRDFLRHVVKRLRPDFDHLSLDDKFAVALQISEEEPIDNDMNSLKQIVFERMKKFTALKASLVLTDVYRKRTKKEVNENIPELTTNVEKSEATPQEQRDLELATERRYIRMRESNKDKDEPLVRLTARRMAIADAKIPATLDKAFSFISAGQKVIVFSCFRDTAEAIATKLKELIEPYEVGLAMGGDVHKEHTIREFKTPNGTMYALVLTILSSGTGVDIPNVTQNVIINDISWTPKDADQVEGRAHRVNSQLPVTNHYMVMGNTQDEVIFNLVQKKRHISENIQNADKAYVKKVRQNKSTRKELQVAQILQWEKVQEELRSRIAMEHWAQQHMAAAASNWLLRTRV